MLASCIDKSMICVKIDILWFENRSVWKIILDLEWCFQLIGETMGAPPLSKYEAKNISAISDLFAYLNSFISDRNNGHKIVLHITLHDVFWFKFCLLEWRAEVSGLWLGPSLWDSSTLLLCRGKSFTVLLFITLPADTQNSKGLV